MNKPQPTWAEVEREGRAKRKQELLTQLEAAESAAVIAREMLPVKEKEFADKLKGAKSNERAILHPEDFAAEMRGLERYIINLRQAVELPARIRRRLALLEQQVTREQKQLAELWNVADRDTRRWFMQQVADMHQFDEQALGKTLEV